MKIVYIANIRLPTERAHGLQIIKTCEALGNTGASVELFIPTRKNHISENAFVYYGARRSFMLKYLKTPDLIGLGPVGFFLSALWFAAQVRRTRSFGDADVIYSRDAIVLLQYLFLGRRLVFEAHGKPTFISGIVARHARELVVISHALKDEYIAAGVSAQKILVAPDAVDAHLFDGVSGRVGARTYLNLPSEKNIILYAGHLYPRKGADTLAQAAARFPDMLFVFVGGRQTDITRFRLRWGGQKNICIVGHVSHSRVPWYLRAANLLILPNSAKDEDAARFTSPMKLFEYMASGTPIVASNVPAIREILNEACAYLIEADSVSALAIGIASVFSRPDEAYGKAAKAREEALHYTWDARAQTILRAISV